MVLIMVGMLHMVMIKGGYVIYGDDTGGYVAYGDDTGG
jgi:hypothetical protein